MSDDMYGVVKGTYFCGMERTEELNDRISDRNIPSASLEPQFSMRPVSTKYSIMPIVNPSPPVSVPIKSEPVYNTANVFNPGTAQAPWSGFASQINEESKLRNQFFALQKCEQSEFVPSSNSDLYNSNVPVPVPVPVSGSASAPAENCVQQPFPGLFQEQTFGNFNPNTCSVGKNFFDNCTRQQLKQT